MATYYIQPLDPQEMASRFSTRDTLEPLPQSDEAWKNKHLSKIKSVLDRLPPREADLIRLYFFRAKRQTDIAEIFGVTQAAVSYRIQRALNRIRFLIEIPEVSKETIYKDLCVLMSELDAKIYAEMFESTCQSEVATILGISQGRVRHRYLANLEKLGEYMCECIFKWSNTLEETPEDVETILDCLYEYQNERTFEEIKDAEDFLCDVVDQMRQVNPDIMDEHTLRIADYYKTFIFIRYNFNILREIQLPKWANRPTHSLV
jgi:predicted transcriptional regulator